MTGQGRAGRSGAGCGPLAAASAVLAAVAASAAAQTGDGRRLYDEELRVRLDQQMAEVRDIGPQAGGWLNFALYNFDDASAREHRTLRQYQLRGWASYSVQGVHKFYFRGLLGYDDWNAGQNPIERHGDEFTGLEVERAFYEFNLGKLLQNQTGQEPPVDLGFHVGRSFAEIGTGLVLSTPLDMMRFDASAGPWELMVLLGKTLFDTRNIDDSFAVFDHQRRCLWGAQLGYTGLQGHRPFLYYLDVQDHTRPDPFEPFQAYDYSPRYVGVGSRGSFLLPDLRYQVEAAGEFGKTFSRGVTAGRDSLCAMAVDALLEYYFRCPTRPKVSVEYLWGSGDGDRLLSATSTVGGNKPGTNDNAFNAFGFRDTGLAFAPRMSNIHMYAAGASFRPLEQFKAFKEFEVGTRAFFYHKSVSSGPISDITADQTGRWLGWEWDVYANWRLTSDLSWTIRYGAFMPSSAFSDDSCRQFLLTAVTLSF